MQKKLQKYNWPAVDGASFSLTFRKQIDFSLLITGNLSFIFTSLFLSFIEKS